MKNKYIKVAHISEEKFREIIKYFSSDLTATQIAKLTGLSRQTINTYLFTIRLRILELSEIKTNKLTGQIEVDESYFGSKISER